MSSNSHGIGRYDMGCVFVFCCKMTRQDKMKNVLYQVKIYVEWDK